MNNETYFLDGLDVNDFIKTSKTVLSGSDFEDYLDLLAERQEFEQREALKYQDSALLRNPLE